MKSGCFLAALSVLCASFSGCRRAELEPVVPPATDTIAVDTTHPPAGCYITRSVLETPSDTIGLRVWYDAQGRIDSVNEPGFIRRYYYSGNSVVGKAPDGDRDSMVLRPDGFVLYHCLLRAGSAVPWQETVYEYNGTEVQRAYNRVQNGSGYLRDTARYEWQGGNMVRWERRIYGTLIYEYFMDKPWSEGEPLSFLDRLRTTGHIIRTTNLVKSVRDAISPSGAPSPYTYELDSAGRIERWQTGGGGMSRRHFFTCW